MFVIMEMKYLSDFPRDTYDNNVFPPTISTEAAYHYDQLGVEPYTQMCFLNIRGNIETFKIDFVDKYTEATTIPSNYQQTCCHEFIYGRTLTKATIVAWKYPLDLENKINRKFTFLTQALAKSETERTDVEKAIVLKETEIKTDYKNYNEFVESIP